ncbi:MAG: hypothetical protein ABIA75_07030 [Candidatus Neomarinimicrobiota bacterium]
MFTIMQKNYIPILLPIILSCALGQKAVAVIDFEPINLNAGEALALSERFRNEIQALDTVNVYIDRGSMESVLEEQGFQQTGCTSNECAVELGQMLGAEEIIVGTVGLIGSTYSINVRSIAVMNGKILRTASRDYRGEIDQVLTPGMREVARQFLEQQVSIQTVPRTIVNQSTEIVGQLDEIFVELKPYWDEVINRTGGPAVPGDDSRIYDMAVNDARRDIDNEKWLFGPSCAGAGCGTCNPFFGFAIIPATLGWAIMGDVHVPARRWRQVAELAETEKSVYLKTYKAQVRRTRFQRTLYGATGGFIIGSVIYSLRKN